MRRSSLLQCLKVCVSAALCLASIGNADATPQKTLTDYFISIDGFTPDTFHAIDASGALTAPHGLSWLRRQGAQADHAWPGVVTLTAASHISTITCSTPSKHGIVGNGFLVGGKQVSGYDYPFTAEPLWLAAKRQGRSVLAVAYVGADGLSDDRKATAGIAYPDSKQIGGQRQTLQWNWADAVPAQGWSGDVGIDAREATFDIVLNPTTNETRHVYALISRVSGVSEVVLDDDRDLANGSFGRLVDGDGDHRYVDIFFAEQHADSATPGRLRRAFARLQKADAAGLTVYVSKASYNNAYPESLRQAMDDEKLVWPDYGVAVDGLSAVDYVETQSMIDHFLTRATAFAQSKSDYDIVLFYQPLIDSMGHKYQGKWTKPFDPRATDDVTRAYVEAFRIVDQDLSELLKNVGPQATVALMGDHGMDEVQKTVNFAKQLAADHAQVVRFVTTGSMVLLYPAKDDAATIRAADQIGADLRDRLTALHDGDAAVLGASFRRTDFETTQTPQAAPQSLDQSLRAHHGYDLTKWHWGEALWVYTSATHYWLQYLPLEPQQFVTPVIPGMHGNSVDTDSMATTMLLKGPGVHHGNIADIRLIDVVPTFSRLIGIDPPRDCEGRAVDLP